jgi:hypothetical protein
VGMGALGSVSMHRGGGRHAVTIPKGLTLNVLTLTGLYGESGLLNRNCQRTEESFSDSLSVVSLTISQHL